MTVENGQVTQEGQGQDGKAVDQDAAVAEIAKALEAKRPLKLALVMKQVPFKTEYNRITRLDYGRYVEINLTQQRLWAYQDNQLVFSTPVTTGATGFETITGLFSVQAKQRNRFLNGRTIGPRYNYNVFVKYWMPFSGNYGMHDASWRSSFGGPDYSWNGSKGCVNMSEAAAVWIYNWASVGTPVWVHK